MPLPLASVILLALAAPAPVDRCVVDKQVYRLDIETFDQDPAKGWRALAARPECREQAAELMRRYRVYTEARLKALLWHEAQVRAEAGDSAGAIALMQKARREPIENGARQDDWNAYVDATIGFLKGDRAAVVGARARLAAFPWPEGHRAIDEKGVTHTSPPPNWPLNLDVVDRLLRCFGHSYADAYRGLCPAADARTTPHRD